LKPKKCVLKCKEIGIKNYTPQNPGVSKFALSYTQNPARSQIFWASYPKIPASSLTFWLTANGARDF
jgi:hypothetical protein